jgi:L-lactate dehydrogenase complex protein LldE
VKVALFVTCIVDRFFADAAADAVRLLRSLDVDVVFPADQTCCGQPAWNSGHTDEARRMAAHTAKVFESAEFVVLPSGSCAAMLRRSYPKLLSGSGRSDGGSGLEARTYELSEFVVDVLGVTALGRGLEGRRLAYHHGCHALREIGVERQPLQLLEGAGAEVVPWEADRECCGFGGLFSVKNPEVSVAMADRKLETLPAVDAVVSADGGCLLQLDGRAKRREVRVPFRPLASVLWEARRAGA